MGDLSVRTDRRAQGFTAVGILLSIAVIAAVGLVGWYVWSKNGYGQNNANSESVPQSQQLSPAPGSSPSSQTQAQKYLVIQEWGVRVALPMNSSATVTYSLGPVTADPDGNNIQAARILVTKASLSGVTCATTNTSAGTAFDTGAQYIRSEKTKPFNASRYRFTFKANILTDDQYAYHLNYVTPDCVSSANTKKMEELQASLAQLTKVQ
jgi:hypothetical protein